MSKKKGEYQPYKFESELSFTPKKKQGKRKDVSSNIYYSMLVSNAWRKLTPKQKELYLFCKLQYFGQSLNAKTLRTEKEKDEDNVDISKRFVMNKELWLKEYGIYSESGQRHFYTDMQALIDNGFIMVIANGKNARKKNIYEFSDKWVNSGKWEYRDKNNKE